MEAVEENVGAMGREALDQAITLWTPQSEINGILEMQLSAHAPAFTTDQTAFNGRPGLRPTRCQCPLVRVIAAAHLLYANCISIHDDGSCGVRALAELIL